MPTLPSYPPPDRPLVDTDIVLGFVDGKTVSVPASVLAAYFDVASSADVAALQVTSAYAFPTGSVKREALFAALDTDGH